MKKIWKALVAGLLAVTLTGCMKIRTEFNVSADGTVDAALTMLMSESFLSSMGSDLETAVEEMKASYQEQYPDAKVTVVTEKDGETNYGGVRISGVEAKEAVVTKDGNTLIMELPVDGLEESIADGTDYEGMDLSPETFKAAGMEVTVIVNMPAKAESNVGTVDGKKVTVDLLDLPEGTEKIRITCKLSSGSALPYIIGGVAVAAVAAAFFFLRKK